MGHERKEIRVLSAKYPKLQTLINYVNIDTLMNLHLLASDSAEVINISQDIKVKYHQNIEHNLLDLISRMKSFIYRPRKLYNDERKQEECLYEDRLIEGCMTYVLYEVYEPRFLKTAFVYHNHFAKQHASKAINNIISKENVKYVLECTLQDIFLNIGIDELVNFIRNDIADENFIRYIIKFLQAGIVKEFNNEKSKVVNSNLMAPILADIYLHYIIDLWFGNTLSKELEGVVKFVRCRDQFVFLFEYEKTARDVYKILNVRLRDFDLRIKNCKAKILPEKHSTTHYELSWFSDDIFHQTSLNVKI